MANSIMAGKPNYWFSLWCVLLLGFISPLIVSKLSSGTNESATQQNNSMTVEKKNTKRKRGRKLFEKSLICWAFSAFVPQSDTVVILKNPCAAERDGETLPTSQFPSSSHPPSSLSLSQAASHWSCKLCLRRVYAPFLPKHLLSLTNYSRINYKPFRETDSHQ